VNALPTWAVRNHGAIMKRALLSPILLLIATAAFAQSNPALERVLTEMDQAAAAFKSLQADFTWDQFQKVVNETDTQKGTIFYRKTGNGIEMKADITQPDKKVVLYSGGKVQVYQPKIEQVTEYDSAKNKETFESFLVLGFGGRGHDLPNQFVVNYGGDQTISGIKTAKLELTPKSEKVRGMFDKIILWIDPARGISVQQQFFEPTGDYRLAKYSNINTKVSLPGKFFKLQTNNKTKFIQAGM
jgi:outer membrane lipoprotein-sorting protein